MTGLPTATGTRPSAFGAAETHSPRVLQQPRRGLFYRAEPDPARRSRTQDLEELQLAELDDRVHAHSGQLDVHQAVCGRQRAPLRGEPGPVHHCGFGPEREPQ